MRVINENVCELRGEVSKFWRQMLTMCRSPSSSVYFEFEANFQICKTEEETNLTTTTTTTTTFILFLYETVYSI